MIENDELVLAEKEIDVDLTIWKICYITLYVLAGISLLLPFIIELIDNGDFDNIDHNLEQGTFIPFIFFAIFLPIAILIMLWIRKNKVTKKIIVTNKRLILFKKGGFFIIQKSETIPLRNIVSINRIYARGKNTIESVVVKGFSDTIIFDYDEEIYGALTKAL